MDFAFGRFGYPCELEEDTNTHVMMFHCGLVNAREESGITVNFYLPGLWGTEAPSAEHVAAMIRDGVSTYSHVEGAFEAPDPQTRQPTYYLTMSAVYPDANQGQAFIIKVAGLEDAVYSVSYTTMFSGPPEAMPARIREWLAIHLTQYGPEIGAVTPDPAWLAYLRERKTR